MIDGISLNKRSAASLMRKKVMFSFIIAVIVLVCVGVCLMVMNEVDRARGERRKQYLRIVGDLVDAKSHEMRQRFVNDDTMKFVYLILSESGANQKLRDMCAKLKGGKSDNPYYLLWTLQIELAATAPLLLGKGDRNFVWAVVTIGREFIHVEVQYLTNKEASLQRDITQTAVGIAEALTQRKIPNVLVPVTAQPDLGMLTELPI